MLTLDFRVSKASLCIFCQTGMSLTPDLSDTVSMPDDVVVRRMIALFDYDPWESSPNMDSEVSTPLTRRATLKSTRMQLNLLLLG